MAWMNSETAPNEPPGPLMTPGGFHSFEHRWALSAALDLHMRIGRRRITERTRSLAGQLKRGLAANPGVRLRTPHDERLSAGLVCFELRDLAARDAVARLRAEHNIVAQRHALPNRVRACRPEHPQQAGGGRSSPRRDPFPLKPGRRSAPGLLAGRPSSPEAVALVAGCRGGDQDAGWEQAPALAHGRSAHAIASDGTAVWALGGTDAAQACRCSRSERLERDSWEDVARLPGEGVNTPAAVYLDGRIYVIGGFGTTTNDATAAVHVYDVMAGSWSEAAPLPEPRGGHAAAVVDGKIHVVGGGNSVSTLDLHSVYDPASDRRSEAAPLPRAKGSPAAVVHRRQALGDRRAEPLQELRRRRHL